jgi:hypothetical protein
LNWKYAAGTRSFCSPLRQESLFRLFCSFSSFPDSSIDERTQMTESSS